ncbi:DUF5694 domain-containing protein [Pedobacter duraquae]|uniref:TraB family protein n=1 Tax=Pedobacter duraquae TaxID=425511 RepID=A0A4R6IK15_9SPHI|nr:DUF5694 domain-containing protein [Pedobacter duraquae]TDO22390.1 hypothetical protein CLV32_1363 [Pedobacter duraquae]
MKRLRIFFVISVLLAACQATFAQQQIEIMVLGTSHDNPAKDSLEYQKVQARLLAFNPDFVAGEYVLRGDYMKLSPDSYRRTYSDKIIAYIDQRNPGLKYNAKDVKKAEMALKKSANFHKIRIDLALQYIRNYDFANAAYQVFLLEKYYKPFFGKEELSYYNTHLGTTDSLKKIGLFRETSEYTTIIFPMLKKQNLDVLYAMDCQTYDLEWSKAWDMVARVYPYIPRIAKLDPKSEEGRVKKRIDSTYKALEAEAAKSGLTGYALLNTETSGRYHDLENFYGGPSMLGFSKAYPDDLVKEMLKYWMLRNEGMASNAITQIRQQGAKRAIIVAGAGHQKWLSDLLRKEKDVKLVNYND